MRTASLSGENVAEFTTSLSACNVTEHSPLEVSQTRTVPSKDTVNSWDMLGENVTLLNGFVWPLSTCKHSPDGMLQMRAVASMEALTAKWPSGENPACVTP